MRFYEILSESQSFINELGNEILVDVTDLPIDGVDGVNIHIEGPTSETDNHTTRMEAKVIFRQMAEVLDRDELDEAILNETYVNCFTSEEKEPFADRVLELIKIAYAPIGGNSNIVSARQLIDDTGMWKLVRRRGEIIFANIYKDRQGRKGMAIGHDGSDAGKAEVFKTIIEDIKLKRSWSEVSGASAKVAMRLGTPVVPNNLASELLNKPIIAYGDDGYSYTRSIGGQLKTKIIIGFPNGRDLGTIPDEAEKLLILQATKI
jgi:hypothetical protein